MKNYNASKNQTTGRSLLIACATAFTVACTVSLSQSVHAHYDDVTPPPVPSNIRVPAGNKAFLKGFAVGTQNYICLPSGAGFAWAFFGPQATLFDDDDKQIITHFLSPNPVESGTPRATWQHSRDTSTVWAMVAPFSTPVFVTPGAIPWLLLEVVGDQDGPTDGYKLTETTFIQRLNTSGGVAPATGCAVSADVGKKALVDYEADYFFYRAADRDTDDD
jgi:Protein of unknown function (DUF3455)